MNHVKLKLPQQLLAKAIRPGNEYGWAKTNVLNVIESTRKIQLSTIGGQAQYVWPDATCEMYWLSYDSDERKVGED